MEPTEFIALAGRLALAQRSGPADYRTAISRGYYGAYHLAMRILNGQLRFFCKSDNEHEWAYRHFHNCKMPEAHSAGVLLRNLRESRKCADYDLDDADVETANQALFELERVAEAQRLLAICSRAVNLPTLGAEMADYRDKAKVQ